MLIVALNVLTAIRDYDGSIYFREWNGGVLCGGFQMFAKPIFHTGIPSKFEFQLLPEDWDNFRKDFFRPTVKLACILVSTVLFICTYGLWLFFFS